MPDSVGSQFVDLVFVVIANLVNLLVAALLVVRVRGWATVERGLGIAVMAMALPVGVGIVLNALARRPWWTIALPALLVLFCAVELTLDYILKMDFRYTRLLWPYLMSYYLALIGMMGYSFGVGKVQGFTTLGTYLLNLAATWYSYARVGHG
jgi:hypothetical protein